MKKHSKEAYLYLAIFIIIMIGLFAFGMKLMNYMEREKNNINPEDYSEWNSEEAWINNSKYQEIFGGSSSSSN